MTDDLIKRLRSNDIGWEGAFQASMEAAERLEQQSKRCVELENALKGLSNMYAFAWNLVDGGLIMADSGLERFEAAHKEARRVLGVELMEVDDDGNLTPEHSVRPPSEKWVSVPAKPSDALLRPFYECPPDELESAWNAMVMVARATVDQRQNTIPMCQDCGDSIMAHDPGTCGTCHAIKYAPPALRSASLQDERTVTNGLNSLLHDAQDEILRLRASASANGAMGAVSPDGRVVDKAMVKRLAVQYSLLPAVEAQCQQIGTSEEADFERGTWTFRMRTGFVVTAGEYMIVPRTEHAEGIDDAN